ncbi:MAG TPA: hypothetical protein VFZ61_00335 [Polyangiales bacterium]
MSARAAALILFALAAHVTARAAAHPGPAIPPSFVPGQCITVVDTRQTQELALQYNVPIDDNVFTEGEIQLPDAKTHQFFAFSGAVSKNTAADGYQLFPFDAALEQPFALPFWLDQSDVNRAAGAAGPLDMTGFTAAQVQAHDVLALRPDLGAYVRTFGNEPARVPITIRQAEKGVRWDLRAVAPGLYSVVGYVFSPPYNDWAARAGVIKVTDGGAAVPAATVEPIDNTVFAGQGRRVRGCVDAPAGSTLSAWVRAEDQPNAPWEPWLERQPLTAIAKDGAFELCFLNPQQGRAGVLRMRVEVTAPDGQRSAAYSPDTLLAVATAAACTPSEDTCCAPGAQPDDAGTAAPPTMSADAGAPEAGAPLEAGAALQPEAGAQAEREAAAPSPGDEPARDAGGGCAVRAQPGSGLRALALALLYAVIRRVSARSRRRASRSSALTPIPTAPASAA